MSDPKIGRALLRIDNLAAVLEQGIDNEPAALDVLVAALAKGNPHPELWGRLHLAAAPMIAHSVFNMLGVFNDQIGVGTALLVIALYIVFAAVALAVDRRALLVSSLAYVLFALVSLFRTAGAVELSAAFTGLVIGSALLLLSAFWHRARMIVVGFTGRLEDRLPPVQQPALAHA